MTLYPHYTHDPAPKGVLSEIAWLRQKTGVYFVGANLKHIVEKHNGQVKKEPTFVERRDPKMFKKMFRKRFKIGDTVRLIRTGQKAVIIETGSIPVARKDTTSFVLKFENGSPTMTVMPEDIERAA